MTNCFAEKVRPDPPSNCSVLNQTADAVEVWCRPGFDGGHPQQFQFEIFDTQSAVLLYNKSGRYPHLRVGNLESGVKLFIQVSAFNQRGRSALVPLEAYTVKIADKQTGTLPQTRPIKYKKKHKATLGCVKRSIATKGGPSLIDLRPAAATTTKPPP